MRGGGGGPVITCPLYLPPTCPGGPGKARVGRERQGKARVGQGASGRMVGTR